MTAASHVIFHADMNAFFASVEETLHPEYKNFPMAVCSNNLLLQETPATRRGIILAKNELAKKAGVRTPEPIWQAKQKCPNLILAPPRRDLYHYYYEEVNKIYEQYTEQVERAGIDESYLDVTGSLRLFGMSPLELANKIRTRVERELKLTISVGVSFNKVFAKLGSDYKKPNAVTVFDKNNWRELIFPLPASDMLMVGRQTYDSLRKLGICTIGDIANCDESFLVKKFGKPGEILYQYANGLDDSEVAKKGESEPIQSVGNGLTFRRDLISEYDIKTAILNLSDSVARRMKKQGVKCTTVQVTIKNPELKSITRQKATAEPTHLAEVLAEEALSIIKSSWNIGKPIRMLTVTAQNLVSEDVEIEKPKDYKQMSLFDFDEEIEKIEETASVNNHDKHFKEEKLADMLDDLYKKYGKHIVERASVIENDIGI